jgi:hypothetical protein
MPFRKPLSITSPDHAIALSCYFMLGFFGFIFVAGGANSSSFPRAVGEAITDIWGTTVMLAGLGAFLAAVTIRKTSRPEHNLWVEMWFDWALFAGLGFFAAVTWVTYGAQAISLFIFGAIFSIGALLRAIQIIREQRILAMARAHARESDPVLADPREDRQ